MAIIIMERGGLNIRLAVCGFGGTAKVSHTFFFLENSLSLSHTHTHTHTFAQSNLDKLTPLVPCKELDYRAKLNK